MTNTEIIAVEAIRNGIYTKEEVEAIMLSGRSLNIHTFAMWKSLGYRVKKGEHATITTQLWKHKTKKVIDENGEEKTVGKMFLTDSYLFTLDQVVKA